MVPSITHYHNSIPDSFSTSPDDSGRGIMTRITNSAAESYSSLPFLRESNFWNFLVFFKFCLSRQRNYFVHERLLVLGILLHIFLIKLYVRCVLLHYLLIVVLILFLCAIAHASRKRFLSVIVPFFFIQCFQITLI